MTCNTTTRAGHVAIVVLNWNRWRDTIACLETVRRSSYRKYTVIIVDNGSSDGSVQRLVSWAREASVPDGNSQVAVHSIAEVQQAGASKLNVSVPAFVIVSSSENLGFARACNVGIRYAIANCMDYVWLLNNDTEIDEHCVMRAVEFLSRNPDFSAVTPQIRSLVNREIVQNCGGRLCRLGRPKYFHAFEPAHALPRDGWRRVTFVTGCAALLRTSALKEFGPLSEDFFFGEEDVEFSYRLRARGAKAACVFGSVVYHRGGASIDSMTSEQTLSSVYIHYLNRFIHMRRYWPSLLWTLWRMSCLVVIALRLRFRFSVTPMSIACFCKQLFSESSSNREVDAALFARAIAKNF